MPSFLFTDVEDSTQLLRDLGHVWGELIDRQRSIIVSAAEGRGHAVSTSGDGCFCSFDDDDGVAALEAAVAAQVLLAEERWAGGADVRVRMGVHAGDAIATGGDWVGLVVHQAARLAAAGHGGQVVTTAELCPPHLEPVSLGVHVVRDFDADVELVQLTAPRRERVHPPLRTVAAGRHNLPLRRTTFVGREHDMSMVGKLVDDGRLVSIVGPGGVGKTRLAVEVAGERLRGHRDGTFLIELTATEPGGVEDAIATAIAPAGAARTARPLEEELAERSVLLVLDSCEHLIDEVAAVVDRLLDHCARLHLLATTREPLAVAGEAVWRLDPLVSPHRDEADAAEAMDHPAARLFVDRAHLASPGFTLDPGAVHVIGRICRRLDGLPLAIELAAARLSGLGLQELDARLAERLDVLDGARRTGAPHQRSLDDLVAWSYELLDEDERRVLRWMSVFVGPVHAEAVDAVCGDDAQGSVRAVLDRLVARSLVQIDVVDGTTRHRLLGTVRHHARRRLAEAGEADAAERAHAAAFARVARRTARLLSGPQAGDAMRALDADLDEIRRALTSMMSAGAADDLCSTSASLLAYWESAGRIDEGRRWLGEATSMEMAEATPERAQALYARAWLALDQGDVTAAEPVLHDCVEVARSVGDERTRAKALDGLARVATMRGDTAAAQAHLAESLAIRRRRGDPMDIAAALNNLAGILVHEDPAAAATYLEESLTLEGPLASPRARAIGLRNVGMLRWLSRDVDAAETAWSEALAASDAAGDRRLQIRITQDLGRCAEVRGDLDGAARLLERALGLMGAGDSDRDRPSLHLDRARVARHLGDLRAAHLHVGQARSLALIVGDADVAAAAAGELAAVLLRTGDVDGARALVDEADAGGGAAGLRIELALADGDHDRAASLLAAAAPLGEPPTAEGPATPADLRTWAGYWEAVTDRTP